MRTLISEHRTARWSAPRAAQHTACRAAYDAARVTARVALALSSLALLTAGCVDKRLTTGDALGNGVTLRLSMASASAETRAVKVSVRYDRANGDRVALSEHLFDITTGAAPQVSVPVDLSSCLSDAAHAGGSGACQLRAAVALRNASGVLLDSVEVGPVTAAPGAAPSPTNVSLAVVATLGISGVPPAGLKIGDLLPLVAKLNDAAGNAITGRSITWSSSNPAVATVDGTGKVRAVSAGTTNIVAQTGAASATTAVNVRALRVDFVRITPMQVLARFGVPQQLVAKVVGDSGVATSIAWQVFDDSVASIDAQGVLRILKDDENGLTPVCAVATAIATGIKTTGCAFVRIGVPDAGILRLANGTTVSVPSPIADSALAINNIIDAVSKIPADLAMLDSGRTIAVESYRVVGAASGGTFTLASSDTTIIAPNADGLSMRLKRRSTTPVLLCATVSTLPGKATCMTIVVQGAAPIRVEMLPSYARAMANDSGQLVLNVTAPTGVSTALNFKSSDPSKVSVSSTGFVRLLQPTTGTMICATAVADTTRVACSTIVLSPRVTGVAITPYSDAAFTKPIGQRSVLAGATVHYKGAAFGDPGVDTRVRWSSSDSTQVRIDAATGVAKVGTTTGAEPFVCVWSVAEWSSALCMGAYVRAPSVTFVGFTPHRATMLIGESWNASAIYQEDPPSNAQVTWSSGDATTVSVTPTGGNTARVTALRATPGVTVCATVSKAGAASYRDCGSFRVVNISVAATLTDTLVGIQSVADLSNNLGVAELGSVFVGGQYQLNAWSKSSASSAPALSYLSSDPTAATVSSAGTVLPKRFGSFPVICAEVIGEKSKHDCMTLSITGDANLRLRVAPNFAELTVGQSVSMVASVDALRGEATSVTWTSLDPSKVTVSTSGVVTAVATTAGTLVCAISTAYPGRRACAAIVVAFTPATPTNTSPGAATSPGPLASSAQVTLSWNGSSGAKSYNLTVVDVASGAAVVTMTGYGGTSYTANLTSSKTYRWYVAACAEGNGVNCSATSTPLYFQTPAGGSPPPTPTSPSPGSTSSPGPTLLTAVTTLSWTPAPGATYYWVQVRNVVTNVLVVNVTGVTGFSYTTTLASGGQYAWRVAACNSISCSTDTAELYFKTP